MSAAPAVIREALKGLGVTKKGLPLYTELWKKLEPIVVDLEGVFRTTTGALGDRPDELEITLVIRSTVESILARGRIESVMKATAKKRVKKTRSR